MMKLIATREQMKQSGVYAIVHLESGKRYVGSAVSFKRRVKDHRCHLNRGTHHSPILQRAWKKYGDDAFEFRIVEVTLPIYAVATEQVFIDYWKATDRKHGYNIAPNAGSCLGIKRSAETLAKISAVHKGKIVSVETRAKLSSAAKGNVASDETRSKISAAGTGRTHSAESRAKMSVAQNGRIHSADTRAKIGAASAMRTHDSETRAKMSASQRRRRSQEMAAGQMSNQDE